MTLFYLIAAFVLYCDLPSGQQHWILLHVQSFAPFAPVFSGPGVAQPDNVIVLPGTVAAVGSYGGLVATLVYFGFLAAILELLHCVLTAALRPLLVCFNSWLHVQYDRFAGANKETGKEGKCHVDA